jgi:tRNA (cytidine/uridine-2'-O-)-methyltransferase
MLHIALYEPEIPPNTGNIMRLCANTGCRLHLIEPLGFSLDDKLLRRAGLDYREHATVECHRSFEDFMQQLKPRRCWALSTHGQRSYADADFADGDVLLFGPETRGLPKALLADIGGQQVLRIPMLPDSRSLNLSNAAALVAYEGLRQLGFPGIA